MDWQQTFSLVLVAATAVMFVRGAVKKRLHPRSSSTCGDCPNCSSHADAPKHQA